MKLKLQIRTVYLTFILPPPSPGGQIVECVGESLCIAETPVAAKVARLFLVSDILYNCAAVPNAALFRSGWVGYAGV